MNPPPRENPAKIAHVFSKTAPSIIDARIQVQAHKAWIINRLYFLPSLSTVKLTTQEPIGVLIALRLAERIRNSEKYEYEYHAEFIPPTKCGDHLFIEMFIE